MPFPADVKEQALVACARYCCICHKFCGTRIECHHIKPEGQDGPNTFDNCIPLCFDCHSDVETYNPKHPKGNKYSDKELVLHRDNWYEKVKNADVGTGNQDHLEMDKALFLNLRRFVTGSSFSCLDEVYYQRRIRSDVMTEIRAFYDSIAGSPQIEFMDSIMEGAKAEVTSSLSKLMRFLSAHLFFEGDDKHLEFEPDRRNKEPQEYHKALYELGDLLNDLFEKRDKFIRTGRKRLAIN